MHVTQCANAFNGRDFSIVWQTGQFCNAGTGYLAINNDVAGTAVTLTATNLAACKQKTLTQETGQRFAVFYNDLTRYAIDNKCTFNHLEVPPLNFVLLHCSISHDRIMYGYHKHRDQGLYR